MGVLARLVLNVASFGLSQFPACERLRTALWPYCSVERLGWSEQEKKMQSQTVVFIYFKHGKEANIVRQGIFLSSTAPLRIEELSSCFHGPVMAMCKCCRWLGCGDSGFLSARGRRPEKLVRRHSSILFFNKIRLLLWKRASDCSDSTLRSVRTARECLRITIDDWEVQTVNPFCRRPRRVLRLSCEFLKREADSSANAKCPLKEIRDIHLNI